MEGFALHIVANPLLYVGYLFAAAGAMGILLFFGGFFACVGHLFSYSEDAHHMEQNRTRCIWGLYICMVTLGLWQCIRLILGEAPASSALLIIILLSPAWAPWLKRLVFGGGGGH